MVKLFLATGGIFGFKFLLLPTLSDHVGKQNKITASFDSVKRQKHKINTFKSKIRLS